MSEETWIGRMIPRDFFLIVAILLFVLAIAILFLFPLVFCKCEICGKEGVKVDKYGVCKECKVKAYRTILSDTKSDGQSSLK